jgi:hypothetical protein
MAQGSADTEYHLTPRGWKTGHPSSDRVETWLRAVRHQSGGAKEYICWVCQWADPNLPRSDRDKLRAKHKGFMGRSSRWQRRITIIGEPL